MVLPIRPAWPVGPVGLCPSKNRWPCSNCEATTLPLQKTNSHEMDSKGNYCSCVHFIDTSLVKWCISMNIDEMISKLFAQVHAFSWPDQLLSASAGPAHIHACIGSPTQMYILKWTKWMWQYKDHIHYGTPAKELLSRREMLLPRRENAYTCNSISGYVSFLYSIIRHWSCTLN